MTNNYPRSLNKIIISQTLIHLKICTKNNLKILNLKNIQIIINLNSNKKIYVLFINK